MRRNIVHEGADKLRYEIREIVETAQQIGALGQEIYLENIGDPVAKGEKIAPWIKEIVAELAVSDESYAYTDSRGDLVSRKFLAETVNSRGGVQVTPNDIIFFNGLGDAVAKLFGFLKREARVIGPSPAYATHSSAEAAHSGYDHLTYALTPENHWLPDIDDMRNKVRYNDAIAGILLINPDNPTGIVYKKELLEQVVDIAATYDLFIIADETYANVVFPGTTWTSLSTVLGNVPGISMRSVSKSFPWPGARAGWIEVYNRDVDPCFSQYVDSLVSAKRLEVCSTTLPQLAIPKIMGSSKFIPHVRKRAEILFDRAKEAYELLKAVPGIDITMPEGALYMTVRFQQGVLNHQQVLPIENPRIQELVKEKTTGTTLDKRFVLYLLGATGICVVPLTSFCSALEGFRFTLLETDDARRDWIYKSLKKSVEAYLGS